MRKERKTLLLMVLPCAIAFAAVYLYPVIRTLVISFFSVKSLTAPIFDGGFVGLANFTTVFGSLSFRAALRNTIKFWLVGGIVILSAALLFAVILTGEIRFKKFFRAAIYSLNIVSAVALSSLWLYYIYSYDYGLLNQIVEFFGLEKVQWLSVDKKFGAILFAMSFAAVGYYMLIFISGIEQIPKDIYDAALIDGANGWKSFRYITLPLLRNVIGTNLTFWTIQAIGHFTWVKMFQGGFDASTVTPVVYIYEVLFGDGKTTIARDAGLAAAAGVVITILVIFVDMFNRKVIHSNDLEF